MRFTLNAFVVSTVALLSLITPVVKSQTIVANFTSPTPGQKIPEYQFIEITWTVTNSQGLDGVICGIGLQQTVSNPSVPSVPNIMQNVSILSGQSNGPVQIPDLVGGDNYFFQLLSADQLTIYAQSADFTIT